MKPKGSTFNFNTQAVHAGEKENNATNAVCLPIYQSATYLFEGAKEDDHGIRYARLQNTPNHLAIHKKIATLEGAEAALVTSSGMAAISTSILALLKSGDHILVQAGCYGGAYKFFKQFLPSLGITSDFVTMEGTKLPDLSKHLKKNTKAIYVETISNPLVSVVDLEGVVAFAKANSLTSIIDSTFASPANANPLSWGFDLVVHSATKALNGHSDVLAGALAGSKAIVNKIEPWLHHLGGTLDAHACYLLNRGMKTLGLRVRHQNESALKFAHFLSDHPKVKKVYYPLLETSPDYARAKKLLKGAGGVVSFEAENSEALIHRLKIPMIAPSLGGVETLVTRPVTTSHSWLSPEARVQCGISDDLIRVSLGIEDVEDLIQDFNEALRS